KRKRGLWDCGTGLDSAPATGTNRDQLVIQFLPQTVPAGALPAPHAFDGRYTTQQHNTHIRDLREICYSWHPWHGRAVWVHATLVKRGRAVAHCSLQELQTSRVLAVPLWMLDVAACCKTRVSKPGFARAQSLGELNAVL